MSKLTVSINQKAYDITEEIGFKILDVLHIFGAEVWDNNADEFQGMTESEVSTAFVQFILDQADIANQIAPKFF